MARVLVLPGDGIGPEVTAEAVAVLRQVAPDVETEEGLIGGCAIDAEGVPLSPATLERAKECGLVLLGAVGGPKWDALAPPERPERGLLTLRKELGKLNIEKRTPDISGLKLPTWQNVLDREYDPWNRDRIVIDTAGKSVEQCVDELLTHLPSLRPQAQPPRLRSRRGC